MIKLARSTVERFKSFLDVMGPSDADPESELDWQIMNELVNEVLAEFNEGSPVVIVAVKPGEQQYNFTEGSIVVVGK